MESDMNSLEIVIGCIASIVISTSGLTVLVLIIGSLNRLKGTERYVFWYALAALVISVLLLVLSIS